MRTALIRGIACLVVLTSAIAPSGGAERRHVRPGLTDASVMSGMLSPPSSLPATAIARAYLATAPEPLRGVRASELRVVRERALPQGGATVKLLQTWAGLDVVGATVGVRIDDAGRVRWMAANVAPIPAGFDATPALSAAQAVAVVKAGPAKAHGDVAVDLASATRLVIWAPGPHVAPTLAWRVTMPGNFQLLETLRVVVDARTGDVLYRENLTHRAFMANVFTQNPTVTPAVTQVSLEPYLNAGAQQLIGPDIIGRNCIDNLTCIPFDFNGMTLQVHSCEFVSSATMNAASDFTDIVRPATDLEPEDDFAEVQMFYHATKAFDVFRGYGLTDLTQKPMQAVGNVRIPDFNDPLAALCSGDPPVAQPGSLLVPFDNAAFFTAGSAGSFPPEDMIIFGQGTNVDMAYDGDVVYHEFGHAVMGTVCPDYGPAVPDLYGLDLTPHGTYEGYADFFSVAITEDPAMGDYAGPGLTGMPGALRTALNTKKCPDDLWGEEHQDGEPWVGALWDIRSSLANAGERAELDQAVFVVVDLLGMGNTPIGDTSTAIAAELELRLGAAAGDLATTAFAARGYDDCDNRVIDLTAGGAKAVLNLRGTDYVGLQTLIPGVVQFRINLPEDATSIEVAIAASQSASSLIPGGGGAAADVKLLIKKDEPIMWAWTATTATPDSTAMGNVVFQTTGNLPGAASVTGAFAAGTYYVQLANAGSSLLTQQISFSSTPGNIVPDAGPMPDAGGPDAGTPIDGDSGDCGCRAGGRPLGSGPLAGALLGLAGLALLVARRRR